ELLPNRSEMSICRKLTHLKIKKDRVALLRNKSSNRSGLSLEKIDSIAVDNKFNEIIDGCLLGDGSATRGGFCYSSVSEQHVKFVYDILSVFGF
ncbi:hypothetical protein LRR18_18400, partial [Mangrovimonas sp. AS39]|uniref:hypothetical protein n=1 Tax=Mangrovimonas futianensis TaxID=2895523 RepID=UPI001E46B2D3